jgi:hypothetical protein
MLMHTDVSEEHAAIVRLDVTAKNLKCLTPSHPIQPEDGRSAEAQRGATTYRW